MRKVFVIAAREFKSAVKTKAFVVSIVMMPIFMGASIALQSVLRDKVDVADKRVAVLDISESKEKPGAIVSALDSAVEARNSRDIFRGEGDERKQVKPRFLLEHIALDGRPLDQATFDLSERVRNRDDLFAFLVVDSAGAASGGERSRQAVRYHSNSPTNDDVEDWAAVVINDQVRLERLAAAGLDAEVVRLATETVGVATLGLVTKNEQGEIVPATKTNRAAGFLVPMMLMMLMFMVVMVGASPLVQSVIEEKMQRIAEVLLGSVTPFELMLGKLLGTVGVSYVLVVVYFGGGFLAMQQAGMGGLFPAHLVWWFVAYQGLAVLLFGSMFIAVGAAVTDSKEAQTLMTPVMLVVCSPMFVWFNVVREPQAPFAVAASLFPPATPMLMMLRQAVPPGVPSWQPALGIVLVLLTTLLSVFAAGRIFRVGILMQGRGAKFGEMIRWVIRG